MGDFRNLFRYDDTSVLVVDGRGQVIGAVRGGSVQPVRYVLYSPARGVYLGSDVGTGVWSRADPPSRDTVPTFATIEAARAEGVGGADVEVRAVICEGVTVSPSEYLVRVGLIRVNNGIIPTGP